MKTRSTTSALAVFSILSMALLSGCGKPEETTLLRDLFEGTVVNSQRASTDASPLLETDYLLLYFSAHWCPPCKAFTPNFVDFYNTRGGNKRFQAVLISSDKSEEKMFAYMSETQMPWPAVRFDSASAKILKETYSGDGIPRLVLLDPQGKVIADSFDGEKYRGPQHVLNYLQKQLGGAKPAPTVQPKASIEKEFTQRFVLNGLAKRGTQNIAIINGKVASVGTELDEGVRVEAITDTHADLSFEGKRYRLSPSAIKPASDRTSSPPKK